MVRQFGLAGIGVDLAGGALPLAGEVRALLDQGLFDCASLVGQFLVSQAQSLPSPATEDARLERIDALVLLADAFSGQREFRRAIARYTEALQQNQLFRSVVSKVDTRSLIDSAVRLKIAAAYVALGDDRAKDALDVLEAVAQKTVQCHMLMGQLNERLGRIKSAVVCYFNAIEMNPMAVSAALALVRLGADVSKLTSRYRKAPGLQWIEHLLEGHARAAVHDHRAAHATFSALSLRFPSNYHVLVHKACAQLQLSETNDALATFSLASRCDPYAVDCMDIYAWALRMRNQATELGSLSQRLLAHQHRPQPWVAVALFCDQRNDRDKAVKFLEKAIALSPRHITAYLVKGYISLATGCADEAVTAYKQANLIDRRELDSYTGLVEAYLGVPQFNDALFIAKACVQVLPNNARALTLFGNVLARTTEGRDNARKAFTKALQIDPNCHDACIALVKLCMAQSQFQEAITLLEKHLAHHPTDAMHTKLANAYALSGNVSQALFHYHTALSMTPDFRPAQAGLERLEASLKERCQEDAPDVIDDEFELVYQ
ncbi:Anaphase-promoting complex subunit 7 [Plasmodiophora brassicae]|nr:hypothetical protein PBRA_008882 [Plasmodiophora brassicae]